MIDVFIKIPLIYDHSEDDKVFLIKPESISKYYNESHTFYLWGDPILPETIRDPLQLISQGDVKNILENISGHYCFLLIDKHSKITIIGNSLFGILPLYYSDINGQLYISNNPAYIAKKLPDSGIDKRFLLENLLFNYTLFNNSAYRNVKLLPSNNYIKINANTYHLIHHTHVEDLFTQTPLSPKSVVDDLAALFLNISKKYFPDEYYVSALTGGFDSRTLVSSALYHNKQFTAYGFGSAESSDLLTGQYIAGKINIPYHCFKLNEDYIENHSLQNGLEFISGCFGNAGFARAHYLYAAKELSKNYKYVITGNFGSELFRAAHVAGAVISPNLYRIFNADDHIEAIRDIEKSEEYNWLNKEQFRDEWDELKYDLKNFICFNSKYNELTKNQKFYKFIFEEVFRKYFSSEIINQFKYIVNRTPYLDYEFVKALLNTGLAGIHSDFFTHNPLKRYKGQLLYAHIIKKSNNVLVNESTNKGYRPVDLLSAKGYVNITSSYIKKQIKQRYNNNNNDEYSVKASFLHNVDYWKNMRIDPNVFNAELIRDCLNNTKYHGHSYFIALSQAYWYNRLLHGNTNE